MAGDDGRLLRTSDAMQQCGEDSQRRGQRHVVARVVVIPNGESEVIQRGILVAVFKLESGKIDCQVCLGESDTVVLRDN